MVMDSFDEDDFPTEEEAKLEEIRRKLGIQGEAEEEPEVKEEEEEPDMRPPYAREDEPTAIIDRIKWWLLRGKSDETLVEEGFNPGTVRISRLQLESEGLLAKKVKEKKTSTKLTRSGEPKPVQVFAKGSPPEAIINSISLPVEVDGSAHIFEQGLKFGMSVLVLATRVMQELSAVGLQQSKPLIDMAKEMRAGESAAYKEASTDAAMKAAQAMSSIVLPAVSSIEETVSKLEKAGPPGADPVKSMMVRTFEPMIQNMMNQLMPGLFPAGGSSPSGWTKRKMEEQK